MSHETDEITRLGATVDDLSLKMTYEQPASGAAKGGGPYWITYRIYCPNGRVEFPSARVLHHLARAQLGITTRYYRTSEQTPREDARDVVMYADIRSSVSPQQRLNFLGAIALHTKRMPGGTA